MRKSKIGVIVVLVLAVFSPILARAEGTPERYSHSQSAELYCEMSSSLDQRECEAQRIVRNQARAEHNPNLCEGVRQAILGVKSDSPDFYVKRNVEECRRQVNNAAFVEPPSWIETIDRNAFLACALLALLYLVGAVTRRGVRQPSSLFYVILFHGLMSFLILGAGGSYTIPPIHDVLFFYKQDIAGVFIAGILAAILIYIATVFFMRTFELEINQKDRDRLSLFYTLALNPFFFPFGPVIALLFI